MTDINLIPERFRTSEKIELKQIEKKYYMSKFLSKAKKFAEVFSMFPEEYFDADKNALITNPVFKIKQHDIVSKEYGITAINYNETIIAIKELNFSKIYWNYCIIKTYIFILEKNKDKINSKDIPDTSVLENIRKIFENILSIEKDIITVCTYKNILSAYEEITKYGIRSSGALIKYINSIIT